LLGAARGPVAGIGSADGVERRADLRPPIRPATAGDANNRRRRSVSRCGRLRPLGGEQNGTVLWGPSGGPRRRVNSAQGLRLVGTNGMTAHRLARKGISTGWNSAVRIGPRHQSAGPPLRDHRRRTPQKPRPSPHSFGGDCFVAGVEPNSRSE